MKKISFLLLVIAVFLFVLFHVESCSGQSDTLVVKKRFQWIAPLQEQH